MREARTRSEISFFDAWSSGVKKVEKRKASRGVIYFRGIFVFVVYFFF